MKSPSPAAPMGPKQAPTDSAKSFKPDTVGVMRPSGGCSGNLGQAVGELGGQHPQKHYDHGPHHGTTHHQRHSRVDVSKSHR